MVDFAELLLRCFELLSRNEVLQQHYQQRFAHILVDEFQDTNRLQYRWLKLLAGAHNAIFAVGDDDQSIYAFRGASASNMFEFERDFAKGAVVKLEQNYRSHGNILDAANALIRHNRKRLGKELWTAEGKGEPLRLFEAGADLEEAAYIVEEIRGLRGEGVRLSDIALLYRSNAQSRVLEHALFNAGAALSRVWRAALLRAPGDQARARLPAAGRESRRRRRAAAGDQPAGARRRRAQPGAVAGGGPHARREPVAGSLLDAAGGQGRLRRGRVRPAHRAHARRLPRACRCARWSKP